MLIDRISSFSKCLNKIFHIEIYSWEEIERFLSKTHTEEINLKIKLEKLANENPLLFKKRIQRLIILSYCVCFLSVLPVLFIFIIPMIAIENYFLINFHLLKIFITFCFISLVFYELTSLKDTPIKGYTVKKNDFPQLFKIIQELQKQCKCPKIHKVIITDEKNITIKTSSRFKLFGFYKYYLYIGLPLMEYLSLEEFKGILAFELAYISNVDGNNTCRIRILYRIYDRICQKFSENPQITFFIFNMFLLWFIPVYRCYMYTIVKKSVYILDQFTVNIVNSNHYANAIIKVPFLPNMPFWQYYKEKSIYDPNVPENAITELLQNLEKKIDSTQAKFIYDLLIKDLENNYIEVNSPLHISKRLSAIDIKPSFPAMPNNRVSNILLGDKYNDILQILDHEFIKKNEISWTENYNYFQTIKQNIKELLESENKKDIDIDQLLDHGVSKFSDNWEEIILFFYNTILEFLPNHGFFNLIVGQNLLLNNDPNGLKFVEKAISSFYIRDIAYYLLYVYYNYMTDYQKADYYYKKYIETLEIKQLLKNKKAIPNKYVKFKEHTLSQEYIDNFIELFKSLNCVEKIYFAQYDLKDYPAFQELILYIKLHKYFFPSKEKLTDLNTLNQKIMEPSEDFNCFIDFYYNNYNIEQNLKEIKNSLIYSRQDNLSLNILKLLNKRF